MLCLRCSCEVFIPDEKEIIQEYKGETFYVKTPVVVCSECGWTTVNNDQADELIKRTKKFYSENFTENNY